MEQVEQIEQVDFRQLHWKNKGRLTESPQQCSSPPDEALTNVPPGA
jgi:hypothetical protein